MWRLRAGVRSFLLPGSIPQSKKQNNSSSFVEPTPGALCHGSTLAASRPAADQTVRPQEPGVQPGAA
ncbi:hypothetical protein NDU88_008074 [Pleurodeles waltl]|uniref:Uncharacterized protein n=1 Tax=Pleurodeles waltl TaxID=8319 RepID=A0AAV7U5I6_PLEWA|nr:hypothetical protein NDU88_008074 [Pleurodeles waltl]